jgi:biopolymer transport protein ExbD
MAKRSVNVDLDLTPFIGLFAMLVVLLLVTAVWNKIHSLSTNTSNVTASDSESTPPKEPEKKVNLTITIMPTYIEVAEDAIAVKVPNIGSDIDIPKVLQYMGVLRTKYPDRKDIIVNTENKIPYDHLIKVFDALVGNGWPDVGVNTQ